MRRRVRVSRACAGVCACRVRGMIDVASPVCCIIPYNHTMQAMTVFSVCGHVAGTFRACAGVRRRSRARVRSRGRAEGGSGLPPLAYRRSEFFIKTFGSFRLPLISSGYFQYTLTRSCGCLWKVVTMTALLNSSRHAHRGVLMD